MLGIIRLPLGLNKTHSEKRVMKGDRAATK